MCNDILLPANCEKNAKTCVSSTVEHEMKENTKQVLINYKPERNEKHNTSVFIKTRTENNGKHQSVFIRFET